MIIFTKDGVPISQVGNDLFDSSGNQVARLQGDKASGPDGRYIATLANKRLIHFDRDSTLTGPKFTPRTVVGFAVADIAGVTIDGNEPEFYT